MPRIKYPCVRCKQKGDLAFHYAVGGNHTLCYEYLSNAHQMYPLACPEKYDCEEGFVSDEGGFFDRRIAMQIALENDQVLSLYTDRPELYSYMLKT